MTHHEIMTELRRAHGRAWPAGEIQYLAGLIQQWLRGERRFLEVATSPIIFYPHTFDEEREGWLSLLEGRRERSQTFRPFRRDGPDADPFAWRTLPLIPSAEDACANDDDLALLLLLIEQVRGATPPAGGTVVAIAPLDPRDGDGWTDAVARQGVRPPSYAEGYLLSTHWLLLQDERLTGTCDRCERAVGTQLHHASYQRLGAETELDTRELCARCHRREHPRSLQKAA